MHARSFRWMVWSVRAAAILACCLTVRFVPVALCGRDAAAWMEGDLSRQLRLARGVERMVLQNDLSREQFRTGSSQFNGEWLFGTYLTAGMGFGQMALEHPELAEHHSELMRICIDKLLSPDVRAFDAETWKEDPLQALDGPNAHAAYLGYLNLLLGLHRLVSGKNTYAELNDRITATLKRHVLASPFRLIESYPLEVYPIDNCFVIGSIALHQRVTGTDHRRVIAEWCDRVRRDYVDPRTGLLFQAVDALTGKAADEPRGSGTALGLMAVYYADPGLAAELYRGIRRSLARTWLGFGAVREYVPGGSGRMDIDSGPIIFGYGLSATGFTIAGARMCDDKAYFQRLFATANLCGAPVDAGDERRFATGGALGNAILFAMMTASRGVAIGTEGAP